MNKTQEALEFAIKRLEKSNFELQGIGNYSCQIYNDKAIEICKQALEQQAEPNEAYIGKIKLETDND